jgi:hypothetical protein
MTMPVSKEDEILYKDIMTMDMIDLGYVAAIEYNDIIIISKGTKQEYKVPKSRIMRYNESEIQLDILSGELDRYLMN